MKATLAGSDSDRLQFVVRAGQQQALELIAKGAPLGETLTSLLRFIEAQSTDMYSSILLLDADGVLKLSERQLSLINRTVSDSVFMLSVDENYNYRFVSVNDAFLATTGLSRKQVLHQRVEEVLPASSHALVLSKYGEAIRDKKSVRWQEIADMPAGRRVGDVVVTPMFDEGGLFLVGAVRDVTERERAAMEIHKLNEDLELRVKERTAQLLNANRELESFTYSVSHDLRAPLRAVTGFGQIIARRHRASLNEEGQRYIDNIVMASERMARLIEELLNYSKLGRRAVTLQPVSLNEILRHVSGLFATRVREVRGHMTLADDLPKLQGDLTLLSQVFTNLIENALTYLRPGTPPDIHVTWESLPDHVLVHVADNGIGIPAEHHEKIFNVFQRLHNDEEFPGTGIGLAVVSRAMELLGGEVKVESEEGQGSIFTVKLPKTEQGAA